jgi:hypothetical protein
VLARADRWRTDRWRTVSESAPLSHRTAVRRHRRIVIACTVTPSNRAHHHLARTSPAHHHLARAVISRGHHRARTAWR